MEHDDIKPLTPHELNQNSSKVGAKLYSISYIDVQKLSSKY
jgi:hypothetical protein